MACQRCSHGCWPAARWAAPWCGSTERRRQATDGRRGPPAGNVPALHCGHYMGNNMARILIVDDSPSQLLGIQRIVEKLGHQILTATDGAAGVETAKAELPDLVLMDVVMPNLNGFQATRTLARDEATRHIPVILVTTKDQDTDRMWGMRQGAKAYITKPFSEDELSEVLERVFAGQG
ncbi:putative transcriptional regulator [Stenotrophomonas maltophilia SKK35]|nr:putative transcriptional regulator [Stenotrophomonas maltophilia SKK35]